MSKRPPAIAFFRMYNRLHSIFPHFIEKSEYHILVDFELDLPASDRIHNVQPLLHEPSINAAASGEIQARGAGIRSYLAKGLRQLPHSDSFSGAALDRFQTNALVGVERVFRYFAFFEKILERYDVKAVVCSPSYLIRHQAIIAAARHFEIPSIHCPHGSFPDPDYLLPEVADYVLMGDRLGLAELQRTRVSKTRAVVTGSPFTIPSCSEEEIVDPSRKQKAREAIGIQADEHVIIYAMMSMDAHYAVFPYSFHTLVENLQTVISAIQERIASGKKYKLFLRQHPSIKDSESEIAIKSIAAEMDFSQHFTILNNQKETLLDAADALISPVQKSSVVFDAFARALPVIALDITPRFPHRFSDTVLNTFLDVPLDASELVTCLSKVEDSSGTTEKAMNSFRFQRDNRLYTGESAAMNMVDFITDVAAGKHEESRFEIV
jgi:hypothetical protein